MTTFLCCCGQKRKYSNTKDGPGFSLRFSHHLQPNMNDSHYLLFSIFSHDRHDYLLSFIKVSFYIDHQTQRMVNRYLKGNFCRSKKLWPQESWWAAEVKVTLENLFRFTSSQCMGSFGRWKSNLLWWKYFGRSWSFSRIRDLFYMKNSQKSFALCAPHCC